MRQLLFVLVGAGLWGLSLLLPQASTAQSATSAPRFPDPAQVSEPFLNCAPALRQYADLSVLRYTTYGNYAYYTVAVNQTSMLQSLANERQRGGSGEGGLESVPKSRSSAWAYWETTVSFDSVGNCLVLVPRYPNRPYSLLEFMPEAPAHQLALQQLQQEMRWFGLTAAALQDGLASQLLNANAVPLPPERIWALQQLGVTIPAGIAVMAVTSNAGGVVLEQGVVDDTTPFPVGGTP